MGRPSRHNQRGWTGVELAVSFGVIFAVMAMLIVIIVPTERYRDARNARRREECYAILNAMLLKEKDDVEEYRGEADAPLDRDAGTAQVIVRRLGDSTCGRGKRTTPTCPGATKAGLHLAETGHACLVLLDDGRYNRLGLVDKYLLSVPIDPSQYLPSLEHRIQGLGLGNGNTGYYINRDGSGRLEVGACQPESGELISVSR